MEYNPINIIEDSSQINPKEGKKFLLKNNNQNYILNIEQSYDDSIIFNLKLDLEICKNYYELQYKYNLLHKLSKLFIFCTNLDESYNLLIDNLTKNEESIQLDINNNNAKISFQLNLPTNKKENIFIILEKKEINIYSIIQKLNFKLNKIEENQKNFAKNIEKKFKDINEISNRQKLYENEIKEIEDIQNIPIKLEEKINNNNKIKIIERNHENILKEIANLKKLKNNHDAKKEEKAGQLNQHLLKYYLTMDLILNS